MEREIDLSENIYRKLENCKEKILHPKWTDEENYPVKFISFGMRWVFTVEDCEGLIFKFKRSEDNKNKDVPGFRESIIAKKICLVYQLNKLVIPAVRQFNFQDSCMMLAEKRLESVHPSITEEQYAAFALDEAFVHLSGLIIRGKYSDMEPRNVGVLDGNKLGLWDLELRSGVKAGLFGDKIFMQDDSKESLESLKNK
jgi:hypothetical protein